MLKRKPTDDPYSSVKVETGGLSDTNCGILLRDIVATRSWTIVIIATLLASTFFRAAVGLGGYSGTLSRITLNSLHRSRHSANVWRFRGAETLDGVDVTCPSERMVL